MTVSKFAAEPVEPAPRDPGGGWLRSKFRFLPWPRPGHEAPCRRPVCPVCAAALYPEPTEGQR
jgi:hypothetical protein